MQWPIIRTATTRSLKQTRITDYPDHFVVSKKRKLGDNDSAVVGELDEATLWRRCALSRTRAPLQRLPSNSPDMMNPSDH